MFDFAETVYGKSQKGWYDSSAFLTPEEYKSCIFAAQEKIGDVGMISNIIENHDEPRESATISFRKISATNQKSFWRECILC